ncbi:MAG: 30S ribosomal protein S20 [Patescibacteria group bacterium]|nr:30S ribosomal protein S20 [Patescibacteria group bacterium]
MPTRPSGFRDLRASRRRAVRNLLARERLAYLVRRSRQALAKKDAAAAKTAVMAVVSALDRSVRSGLVKAGYAARHKSRLMLRLNKMGKK